MDLFNQEKIVNVLPYDGISNYHGKILTQNQSQFYYQKLLSKIEWKNDEAVDFWLKK